MATVESQKLLGQPPLHPSNPQNSLQYIPLTAEPQPLPVGNKVPPCPPNFSGNQQCPPPGWSVGFVQNGHNPDSDPVDLRATATTVEVTGLIEDEGDSDGKEGSFSEKKIRMAFIRKVYAILMVQLAVTAGFIALFLLEPNVVRYSRSHPEMMFAAGGCTLIVIIVLGCCKDCRRAWPMNFILLMLFTVCEGWMLGTVTAVYEVNDVLVAAGICAVICLALTIFAFQTKIDFTACGGVLLVSLLVLMMFGFCCMLFPSRARIIHSAYSAVGALVFSLYLIYDTQMMLGGNHKNSISPEDYIFAALSIYLDIMQLFLHILRLISSSEE